MNAESTVGGVVRASGSDDELRLKVSALVDDEFDEATVDRTIDALLASDELARFWADAHRAGDWMRSDEVVGVGDCEKSLQRFAIALANEPSIVAPGALKNARARRFWVRTALPGASVAAALVVVAWVALPLMNGGKGDGGKELATVVVAKNTVGQAGTVPATLTPIDAAKFDEYFAAHREVSPFAYRGAVARPAALTESASQPPVLTSQ